MKILILSPYLPYPPHFGGASRIFNLIRHLSSKHSVTLLTMSHIDRTENDIIEMRKYCERLITVPNHHSFLVGGNLEKRFHQFLSAFSFKSFQQKSFLLKEMQAEAYKLLREEKFDIVQVEFAQMAYYDLPTDAPLVLDEHNIEHDILKRTFLNETDLSRKLFNLLEYLKFRRDEIQLCKKFDICVTTSERDSRVINQLLPNKRTSVVPNGVDTTYFAPTSEAEEASTLVFTGTIRYYPNTEGLLFFLQKIFPLIKARKPSTKLVVVGNDPPEEIRKQASESVVVTGFVPDVRPYLQKATAVIVPLRIGGGTRLKVLEALSMQKPVVTTSVGCEGIDVTHGENVLIADEPSEFAESTIRLIEQAELRRKLAKAGRKLVEQSYDWSRCADSLTSIYVQLTRDRNASVIPATPQIEISQQ